MSRSANSTSTLKKDRTLGGEVWELPVRQKILFIIKNLYTMERLGVMYISAHARRQGWETELLVADDLEYDEILYKIRGFEPDILGFSAMSPEYPAMECLAQRLRSDTNCFIVFGGPHATFFQEIVEKPFIHAVAFGEGDRSFPQFLERFSRGEEFTDIVGMHFHLDGEVIRNGPAPLREELDELPFPDRDLMPKGNPLMAENQSHIFLASRGCPNACTYCFNHKYNSMFRSCGKLFRRRSVSNLIAEIKKTKLKYGTEFAYIDDDIFTLCDVEWLSEFALRFPSEVGIPFMCNVHVKTVNEEKVRLLKQAGCEVICFGIETGDQEVARRLLKRNITNREIIDLSELLHKYEIRFMTQNLMALPLEHPLEYDLKTLDLNIRCRPHLALSHLFFPLPGTELEAYATENGFFSPDSAKMPERTNSYSALTFPQPSEKLAVQRLQKLFGLTVALPSIRPALPLLTRLPLGPLYSLIYVVWYGYTMRFRLEGTSKSGKEVLFFVKSLLRTFGSFLRRPSSRKSSVF
jgi:radical SAM superfamily enzyme YgiQ (UPF0313 family)